jgi:AcrR family transcriptional regulator
MKSGDPPSTRPYTMRARALSVAETRLRIVVAMRDLVTETLDLSPTLDAVAARAGVSVQTVLRHYGTRDGLFDAAVEAVVRDVTEERRAPVGDVDAAVRVLVDHYEARGDLVLRMLAREPDDERMTKVVGPGRALHREWVRTVFEPYLRAAPANDREPLTDLLVVATDVYAWKLLRRDRGLGRAATENRLRRLVRAVLPQEGS